jgi:DNA polymerase I-like protein with 3'-5' exonuclease and polymerase domains
MTTTTTFCNGNFPQDASGAAKLYLDSGLAPVPLPFKSKRPTLENWQRLRLGVDNFNHLFPVDERINVGILNGAPSGNTLDVDLDCAEARRAAALLLPETGWVFGRKSSLRSHWIYRTDTPLEQAQEKYTDLGGEVLIELRGTGGQSMYPPSTHPNGEPIEWERFTEPAEVGLAPIQQAVREVAAAALLARHWPTQGSRDEAAMALAGGLVRAGWDEEKISRFVEAVATAAGDEEARDRAGKAAPAAKKLEKEQKVTGWPTLAKTIGAAGEAVVRRVRDWLGMARAAAPANSPSTKKPRPLEPYQPFPVHCLPEPIREFVRQGQLALGCDPAYLALPALAVAASVIGNARTLRLKRGWEEPSVIWTAVVGDSGTLKSPAFLKAVAHLFRLQKRFQLEFKVKQAKYQEDLQAYKESKRQAKGDGAAPGDPPEAPLLQRVVCSDITIEKLAEILEDNPRGTLAARDELSGWLGSFGRYKSKQGGTDLPAWLEFFRAGHVVIDRKTTERKNIFIDRAAVSVTGGIQPGVLTRALTPEFLDAGLAARLLLAMPPKLTKRWSEVEVAPEVEQAYHDVLDQLLLLAGDDRDGEPTPHVLQLSPEGKAAWVTFYDHWAREQAAVEGELAAAFSKLEAYAARFALVHHVVGRVARGEDDLVPVAKESIEAGVTLCRWFANEARRIYATLTETKEEGDIRRLVEFLHSHSGRMTARRLRLSNTARYPTVEAAEGALNALAEAGLGAWEETKAGPLGGRPSRTLVLHDDTTCFKSYETSDDGDEGDDAGDGTGATNPPTKPPSPGENPQVDEGFVGFEACSTDQREPEHAPELGKGGKTSGEVSLGSPGGGSTCTYLLVNTQDSLQGVVQALDDSVLVGLDLETTGLNPRTDRVRLLSLALDTIDGGRFTYLVDCFAVDPAPLLPVLAQKELIVHNGAFDLAYLFRQEFKPSGVVHDTMLLARLLTAGTNERNDLATCCSRWLNRPLDKEQQRSDWSGELSDSQLAYAVADVEVLAPLLKVLTTKIKAAGLADVAKIEARALPGFVWLAGNGVPFDRACWDALTAEASSRAKQLVAQLDAVAPSRPGFFAVAGAWDWNSPLQVKEAFAAAGLAVDSTADDELAKLDHPMASLLRDYRAARKLETTYGIEWAGHVAGDGRIYATWNQLGTVAGRISCSGPNLQQVPRDPRYRRCFAAPAGRVLVKADYSQLQLRIAAKVSGDKAMLDAYARGEDLHTLTARKLTGMSEVSQADRQLAKAVNFGLLFGAGARRLKEYAKANYGLDLSEDEARRYRRAFFNAYPGLERWQRKAGNSTAKECRTLAGRRRLLDDKTPFTFRLNSPVQGTEADGAKLALALLWERRDQVPGAFPVLFVHDEIVVECDADQAEAVATWLKTAMVEAMCPLIAPVPVEVEVKVARTWGGDVPP